MSSPPPALQSAPQSAAASSPAASAAPKKPPISGISLFILGVFLFSSMDALAKDLVARAPALQVAWLRYLVQAVVISALLAPRALRPRSAPPLLYTAHPFGHFIRACFQVGATGFFFAALAHIGLAEATALADTNPVLITLGAALFLGERLTPPRLIAVFASMVGALIILRPGGDIFTPSALLPLGCALCFAGNALMTRALGQNETAWTSLFYAAWFGTAMLTAAMPFVWQPLLAADLGRFALLGVIGTASQAAVIMAFSRSEAGLIAPFGYLGIVFATGWSVVVYNKFPDGFTVLGALVIIAAGLYAALQDRASRA